VFGSIVHDPVRDYQIGPDWWHRRSVAAGYSFLREAFVHEAVELQTVKPMPMLRITTIPHGPYEFPLPSKTREQFRAELKLPARASVVLSFGHVRDSKNLDLVIRALASLPSTYLLVAGQEQSSGQKPLAYYQAIAQQLGIGDRCRWLHGFIPASEVGNLFEASDMILLTYSRNFRSASGVLNTAVRYRKPCLASGGRSNLLSAVEQYNLGWCLEPDDQMALTDALKRALRESITPGWDAYEAEYSWKRNAAIVCDRMFSP
jgi:glycosyltransferase involved in cell wall biosynthesis